ncbi:hypothetical protein HPP92_012165 [Vanilla planifolia]|uniref:Uncharacterized protein n=1 Tax=Vanilla planifolia TaxID=51239 RepID=A0A835R775_VANPL|nr:hypothetical protein HPP92_012165 [Vanilla planifolia]
MATKGFAGAMSHIFRSLGPAILISVAYIDLGKWLAAVEGGARFGFELVLPLLVFNCIAVLCQYLSTGIGMVTGKNLAEVCSEEYSRQSCILLGVLAELSMIISDLTMVLGIAYVLNLQFGIDLFSCIFVAIPGALLLPLLPALLDNHKFEAMYVILAGFVLLFYVVGVLISQPEVPVITNELFPKLTGENAYSVMSLLGANIMVHNFYIHSSVVQQRRSSNVSIGNLFQDHFFAILIIFTGIFLVNYVLISSAAAVFGNADVAFNIQDVSVVMDQIFKNPVAPVAFLWVLFISCQITALTRNIGGKVILQHLFDTKLSALVHLLLAKGFTASVALCCVITGGAEGIYQSFIMCQIMLGMLLPSSAIPLFRVASSRVIMGAFKASCFTEILAFVSVTVMLIVNVIFIVEVLFGNSTWTVNLKESSGTAIVILYFFLLLGFTSICFTFYLATTPLKSANNMLNEQMSTRIFLKDLPELCDFIEESNPEMIKHDDDLGSVEETAFEKPLDRISDKSATEYTPDEPHAVVDSDPDSLQTTYSSSVAVYTGSPCDHPEFSTSIEGEKPSDVRDSLGYLPGEYKIQQLVIEKPVAVNAPETNLHMDKGTGEGDAPELENSGKCLFPQPISEDATHVNISKGTSKDGVNSSGNLSKPSRLGRAGRRQLAAILDEFWANLFDLHGKLTQDASSKRLGILLGIDMKMAGSSGKVDSRAGDSCKVLFTDTERGQYFFPSSRDNSTCRRMNIQSGDLPIGIQMGNSWSQNLQQSDALVQGSSSNIFNPAEKTYSSLRLPQYSNDRDHQPATIHGYQMASYLREIGTSRNSYTASPRNLPSTSKFSTAYVSPLRYQDMYNHGHNNLGSMQNSDLSRINTLQVGSPYYEPPLIESSEHAVPPAYAKKYHSSPDISGIIALTRNLYLNEGKRSTPIGSRTSFGGMAVEQSTYLNPLSRAGTPLAFDDLSPTNVHKEMFPLQSTLNSETRSLFSKQSFEELFGMVDRDHVEVDQVNTVTVGSDHSVGDRTAMVRSSITAEETFPYAESEARMLNSLRFCIMKILKLDGSDWLFRQSSGADEVLIEQVAIAEKGLHNDSSGISQIYANEFQCLSSDLNSNSIKRSKEIDLASSLSLPNCGDGCVWRSALVVSFGVWCIQRILELSLVESRPELWGKYTFVLNRLQGIIEPAFFTSRQPLLPCTCLDISAKCLTKCTFLPKNGIPCAVEKFSGKSMTSASMVLDLIRDVEAAVSSRKGRTGTAAGDVAFPKGKENLVSVLKRYKRRLSNKP